MSFDRLAPHYRWLEVVLAGRLLQRARTAHIAALDEVEHVLIAGSGPGRFLQALRRRRPDVRITVVDQSAEMLRIARRHTPQGPTTFLQADLRDWDAPEAVFDAIVTPCVLDCFGPDMLPQVMEVLAFSSRARAHWLLTDFAIPAAGWRRARARMIHRAMYAAFRLAVALEADRLTPPDPWLRRAGFTLSSRRIFNAGLIHSDHWLRSG
jgi:cyclopropane fatty-acyl-phospholipid synthase-like methyltransferase